MTSVRVWHLERILGKLMHVDDLCAYILSRPSSACLMVEIFRICERVAKYLFRMSFAGPESFRLYEVGLGMLGKIGNGRGMLHI